MRIAVAGAPVLRTDWRSIGPHPCFDPSSCGSAGLVLRSLWRSRNLSYVAFGEVGASPSRLCGQSHHAMLELLLEGGRGLPPLRTAGNGIKHNSSPRFWVRITGLPKVGESFTVSSLSFEFEQGDGWHAGENSIYRGGKLGIHTGSGQGYPDISCVTGRDDFPDGY